MRNGPRWLASFRLRNVQTPAKIGKCESLLSIGSSFPFAQNILSKSWRIRSPKNCRRRGSSESICSGPRLSQVQGRANSRASRKRNRRGGHRYKYAGPKNNTKLRFDNSITIEKLGARKLRGAGCRARRNAGGGLTGVVIRRIESGGSLLASGEREKGGRKRRGVPIWHRFWRCLRHGREKSSWADSPVHLLTLADLIANTAKYRVSH